MISGKKRNNLLRLEIKLWYHTQKKLKCDGTDWCYLPETVLCAHLITTNIKILSGKEKGGGQSCFVGQGTSSNYIISTENAYICLPVARRVFWSQKRKHKNVVLWSLPKLNSLWENFCLNGLHSIRENNSLSGWFSTKGRNCWFVKPMSNTWRHLDLLTYIEERQWRIKDFP